MALNNIYYIDMEERFNNVRNGIYDKNMKNIHELVYSEENVMLAVRQLSKSSGKYSKGIDGSNYSDIAKLTIPELTLIVKDRLLNKKMDYVRRIHIPKSNGKLRPLGICSIYDKLVEMCIKLVIEPYFENIFVPSSYGFREQVKAHDAITKVKAQVQTMSYALSIDMEDYFGSLDPEIMYRELYINGLKNKVILNYIFRFIKKGYYEDSCKVNDEKGAPQGSILGPLLANIYLHRLDVWIRDQGDCWHDKTVTKFHNPSTKRRNLLKTNLKLGIHVRYADDILILCKNKEHAERFKFSITKRLEKDLKLKVNTSKTKIVDLTKENLTFLGYDFKLIHGKTQNKLGRKQVANTISKDKMNNIIKEARKRLHYIKKNPNYENFMRWNLFVIGLHNYFDGLNNFYKCFNSIGWRIEHRFNHIMNRYAKFTNNNEYKNQFLNGKYKSWGENGYYYFAENIPIIKIGWANWNKNRLFLKNMNVDRDNPYTYPDSKKHVTGVDILDIKYLVECAKFSNKSSRYNQFRISKYSANNGKSYICSDDFVSVYEYNCHHIIPISKGGLDDYNNLCILSRDDHVMLHNHPSKLYDKYKDYKNFDKKIKPKIDYLINSL